MSEISYYTSAKDQAPSKAIAIKEFVRMVKQGDFEAAVSAVRNATTEDEKRAAKIKLPAVQLSGMVTNGNRAKALAEGRFIHSGVIQLDVDGDGLAGHPPEAARALLGKDPHIMAAFISPSGEGVKALFKIAPCLTDEEHKTAFLAVQIYIRAKYGFQLDAATKDSGRLCFVSHDPDAIWRPMPNEFVIPPPEVASAPKPSRSSKTFPAPPQNGIHSWLMDAAWHCRLKERMDEEATVARLQAEEGKLRRPYQPDEVANAVRQVFAKHLTGGIFRVSEKPTASIDLTRYSSTDTGNAERVFDYGGSNFRYVRETGKWLFWNGSRWITDEDAGTMKRLFIHVMKLTGQQAFNLNPEAAKFLTKHALESLDGPKINSGLQVLRALEGVSVSLNHLDSDPMILGTTDGMIDLKSGLAIKPERDLLVTKSAGTYYDPEATCHTWKNFLKVAACGDMDLVAFLQKAVGYSLTGSNEEQCLFFMHGAGQNGKGVFVEAVKRLLGDYGKAVPESMFAKERNTSATNDIAGLAGCRFAITSELEEGVVLAESRVKALTGGDTITARFLHKEFFDFRPTHHFWISGNHKPAIKGTDAGIWRRMRLLPFVAKIAEADKDPQLGAKLIDELPGILRWAIEGCRLWQAEGLKPPLCVTAATDSYREEEDILGDFLSACCQAEKGGRELISTIYESYQGWSEKGGIKRPETARVFNRKMEERGFERLKSDGGRFWRDLELKIG